jgi:diguanylate cyclase (GGDEF)-like protein
MMSAMLRLRSLRLQLIVPYVALLLGLAATIGALSYFAGSRAVQTVSENLLVETVERIRQAVDRHVVGSAATLEAAFPAGMSAPNSIETDLEALRTRFWIATTLHIDPNNYVYYGNQRGQFVGLYRHSLEDGEWRVKLNENDARSKYRFRGIDGAFRFESRESRVYDPRERPWYTAATLVGNDTWTAVYIDFSTSDLVATRARKVLAPSGAVAGVVATDISLRGLNQFVSNLRVSPRGLAYIVEPSGDLIASSGSPNVKRLGDGSNVRMLAHESGHPLLARVHDEVRRVIAETPGAIVRKTISLKADDGEVVYAAFDKIQDSAGLNWITVVAVPRSDFIGGVTQNMWRTILISMCAALIAVVVGLRILNRVAGDLRRLSEAARRVGDGELNASLRDEIGELARSFEIMQNRLQTDRLTGLCNRESFVRTLEREIQAHHDGFEETPFAVLFIDLNRFKRVNDEYGHDAGDRALIEVAERLRRNVRSGDLVARYAGDEFVVLLRAVVDQRICAQVRLNLEGALRAPFLIAADNPAAPSLDLGGAIGYAYFPDDAGDALALIKIADSRMYTAKYATTGSRPLTVVAR